MQPDVFADFDVDTKKKKKKKKKKDEPSASQLPREGEPHFVHQLGVDRLGNHIAAGSHVWQL